MSRLNNRLGFTLIEVLATMSVGSMMLLIAIAWIGETTKFASRMKAHQNQHDQLTRLAWQLRSDVRLSRSMSIEDGDRLVLRSGDGQQIVYSISGDAVEMKTSGGSQLSRDKFSLATGSLITWDTSGMPNSIGLIVSRNPAGQLAVKARPAEAGSIDATTISPTEAATIPIDIHIFSHVNRWPIKYSTASANRGAQ